MAAPGYERVSSGAARPQKPSRQEFLLRKLQAALWIAFAIGVAYFVDLWHVITDDSVTGRPEHKLHRGFFKLGICCFGMWSLIAAYLIVYVKVILNVQEEWDDYAPKAIPVATACGLLGIISFFIAFWPVWGFLTLPIGFVFFMGMLHSAHFAPL